MTINVLHPSQVFVIHFVHPTPFRKCDLVCGMDFPVNFCWRWIRIHVRFSFHCDISRTTGVCVLVLFADLLVWCYTNAAITLVLIRDWHRSDQALLEQPLSKPCMSQPMFWWRYLIGRGGSWRLPLFCFSASFSRASSDLTNEMVGPLLCTATVYAARHSAVLGMQLHVLG